MFTQNAGSLLRCSAVRMLKEIPRIKAKEAIVVRTRSWLPHAAASARVHIYYNTGVFVL